MPQQGRLMLNLKRFFKKGLVLGCLSIVFVLSAIIFSANSASPTSVVTYQGKLLYNDSAVTGTLPMSFEIYDSLSGGTLLYTASGTLSTTTTINVTPTQGLFTVYLGDETTNSLDPDIFKNNEVLYLQVTIDGETLSPRKRITASPYALSSRDSKYLDGNFATSTPTTTRYIPVSDTSGNFSFNDVTSTNIFITGNATINADTIFPNGTWRSDGKVGIGTTTPEISLVVQNNSSTSLDGIGIADYLGQSSVALFNYMNGGDSHGVLGLYTNGSSYPDTFINSAPGGSSWFAGRVGIGTTSPVFDLNVEGNINFTGDLYQDGVLFSTGSLPSGILGQFLVHNGSDWLATNSFTTTTYTTNILPDMTGGSGNVSLYSLGASDARWNEVWTNIINLGTSTWSLTQTEDRFSIFDSASGAGNERLSILANGNVGIGTSTDNNSRVVIADDSYTSETFSPPTDLQYEWVCSEDYYRMLPPGFVERNIRIYSYKDILGTRYYSQNYLSLPSNITTTTDPAEQGCLIDWSWTASADTVDGYLLNIGGNFDGDGMVWDNYGTTTANSVSELAEFMAGSINDDGPPDVSNNRIMDYGIDSLRFVYDTNNFSSFKVLNNGNLKLSVNQSPTGTITLSEQGTSLLGNVGIGMDLNSLARLSILDNSYSVYSSSTSFQNITVNNTQNIELTGWEDASVFLKGMIPPETGRNVRIYSYKDTANGRIYSDPTYYVIPPDTTSTPAQDYMAIWSWDEVEGADGYLYNGYVQGMGWFLYSVTTNTVFSEFNSSPEFRTFGTPSSLDFVEWVNGNGKGFSSGVQRNARVYSYCEGNDGTIIYSEPVYYLPLGQTTTTPSDDTLISWSWDNVDDEDGYLINIYTDGEGWSYYAITTENITTFNEATDGGSLKMDGPPLVMPTSTLAEVLNETPESFGSDSLRLVYDDNNFVSFKIRNNGLLNINTNGNTQGGISINESGNVGIGASTPGSLLTVDGSSLFTGNAVFTGGNVGIGTSTLEYLLTVDGESLFTGQIQTGYGLTMADALPGDTTNALYNQGGELFWNGNQLSGISSGGSLWDPMLYNDTFQETNAGQSWQQNFSYYDQWEDIAMSKDGKYQTIANQNGYIFRSTDFGQNWNNTWQGYLANSVAMSADGKYQIAMNSFGNYYKSSNYGVNWSNPHSFGSPGYIAISADGKYQTLVLQSMVMEISSDFGATWEVKLNDTWRNWSDVSMSSDGKYQTASVNGEYLYTSSDYGQTWIAKTDYGYLNWKSLAMSSDGKYQTAAVDSGYIYSSADYGQTWTVNTNVSSPVDITMSSDGKHRTAIASNYIYTSNNFGASWTTNFNNYNGIKALAMSSDAKYQTMVSREWGDRGYIYTSIADSYTYGNIGIGVSNPVFGLDIGGTAVTSRKIGINGTQVVYLPNQDVGNSSGSLFIGNGGNALSWWSYNNTGVGIGSLFSNTDGNDNSAQGYGSLFSNTTGSYNSAQGSGSLYSNTEGYSNSAQGYGSLFSNTEGYNNSSQGANSLYSNITGNFNSAQGSQSLYFNTTGSGNSAQGSYSLYSNTTGSYNSAQGYSSLYSNTEGYSNSAQGYGSLRSNTTGNFNSAQGSQSLYFNTTGSGNSAQGSYSLYYNTTGTYNSAQGYISLYSNTTGGYNSAQGYGSLRSNTTGNFNSAQGSQSLYFNTTGSGNSAQGSYSLYYNTTGTSNSALGAQALYNTLGSENVGVGANAGFHLTTGNANTFIGYFTGRGITTGSNNTIIGSNIVDLTGNLSNNIIIADGAGNRRINVDSNGNVGIGTTTPNSPLTVYGTTTINNGGLAFNNYSGINGEILMVSSTGQPYWTSTSSLGISGGSAAGSIGEIQFNDGTGSFDATSTFVWDNVNGRLGIGTSTPSESLTVVGNISNPITAQSGVRQISTASVGIYPTSIYVSGKYAYVTNYISNNISIVDISNPTAPVQISTTSVGIDPYSIYVSGKYAYVTNAGSNNISIVDISNPTAPVQISTTSVGIYPYSIYVSGKYAYVANAGSNNISIVDISNPTAPVQISTAFSLGYNPFSIYVSGKYAYVANYNSNNISIVDISNPTAPVQISTASVGTGPASIYVSGKYAYVANTGSNNISIVDITGTEVSSLIAHSAEAGNLSIRNDLFVKGNTDLSVLTVGQGGILSQGPVAVSAGLFIASTTPATTSYALYNQGGSLYWNGSAVGGGSGSLPSGTDGQMLFYNSSDWAATSSIFISSSTGYVGIGDMNPENKLSVSGNLNIINNGLLKFNGASGTIGQILMVSTTGYQYWANTNALGFVDTTTSPAGTTNEIQFRNNGLFDATSTFVWDNVNGRLGIGTSTPSESLTVVGNISNPITAQSGVRQISTTSVGTSPASIYVSGKYAYVANYNSNNISIVDISNPTAPVQISTASVGSHPFSIYVSGKYAYVANAGSKNISIVDISNPTAPVQISTTSVGSLPRSIYVSGKYAYVTNRNSNNISIVDISNPTAPVQISTASVSGVDPHSIYVSGKYAYVANISSNNISIVDISNPTAPVQISTAAVGANPYSIYVSGKYAYVANYYFNNISIVDISNPTAPVQISTASVGSHPHSIYVSGKYAYVANYSSNNISIVDITGTEVSSLIAHSAEAGNLSIRNDLSVKGNTDLSVLTVGQGGILSQGPVAVVGSFEVFPSSSSSTLSGWVSPDDGSWVNSSDENLKKNIIDFTGSLEKVKMLRPVSYEFKNEKDAGGTTHIGLLAQEIEQIFPQVVSKNSSGLKGISYANLTPILVQAIQEQQEQIDALKNASTTLTVENTEGQIVYTVDMGQDMLGRPLLNVASIIGANNKWEIDTNGTLITKVTTASGIEKKLYGMSSENAEITLSGTSTLENGEARIIFTSDIQEIIDETQPIKVIFSLTSPCNKNIYVSEKSKEGFVLKMVDGNESGITFDWMVLVKRKFSDPFVEEIVNEETSFEPSSSEVEGGETESGVEISDGGEELTPPLQEGEVETPPSSEEDTTPTSPAEDVIVEEEDNSPDPVEEPVVEPVVENNEETTVESSSVPEEVGVTAEEIPVVVE